MKPLAVEGFFANEAALHRQFVTFVDWEFLFVGNETSIALAHGAASRGGLDGKNACPPERCPALTPLTV